MVQKKTETRTKCTEICYILRTLDTLTLCVQIEYTRVIGVLFVKKMSADLKNRICWVCVFVCVCLCACIVYICIEASAV